MRVNIYTDGACQGNPGPGGWGAVISDEAGTLELSGYEADTTNNRMELTAVINAIKFALETIEHKKPDITLTTDSQYVVNAMNQNWLANWQKNGWRTAAKKPVLNQDLWQKLLALLKELNSAEFVWVKGHAEHPENERCDQLAVAAIGNGTGAIAGIESKSDNAPSAVPASATGDTDHLDISDLTPEAKMVVINLVNQLRGNKN